MPPELIDEAKSAFADAGVEAKNVIPICGGTDGAQLSFREFLRPNPSTGGYRCHGVKLSSSPCACSRPW